MADHLATEVEQISNAVLELDCAIAVKEFIAKQSCNFILIS
jgi:hypothetical protein